MTTRLAALGKRTGPGSRAQPACRGPTTGLAALGGLAGPAGTDYPACLTFLLAALGWSTGFTNRLATLAVGLLKGIVIFDLIFVIFDLMLYST